MGSNSHCCRLAEGYTKYTKKGLYYISPDFSGKIPKSLIYALSSFAERRNLGTPSVVIPREDIPWLIDHDDRKTILECRQMEDMS